MPLQIRPATVDDLDRILELGEEFSHQMLYQKDRDIMLTCIPRILVAESDVVCTPQDDKIRQVVGYYHYIVSGDPGLEEMLTCWRQFPEELVMEATKYGSGKLCVAMQGGCHRDAFETLIKDLQKRYPEIWCWNSVTDSKKPSGKIDGYKSLGFTYNPYEKYTFFNVNKGGESIYTLGRWNRDDLGS